MSEGVSEQYYSKFYIHLITHLSIVITILYIRKVVSGGLKWWNIPYLVYFSIRLIIFSGISCLRHIRMINDKIGKSMTILSDL